MPWQLRGVTVYRAIGRSCSTSAAVKQLPVLTLFTKKNEPCSLCDDAKEVLEKYKSKFHYEEKYIDEPRNSEWYKHYKDDIPVIHVNGQYLMKHKIDKTLLLKTLKKLTYYD